MPALPAVRSVWAYEILRKRKHERVKPRLFREEIIKRFKEIRRLYARGVKMVFPDIVRLEKLMLDELAMHDGEE